MIFEKCSNPSYSAFEKSVPMTLDLKITNLTIIILNGFIKIYSVAFFNK